MFEVSADETVELAAMHRLHPVLNLARNQITRKTRRRRQLDQTRFYQDDVCGLKPVLVLIQYRTRL